MPGNKHPDKTTPGKYILTVKTTQLKLHQETKIMIAKEIKQQIKPTIDCNKEKNILLLQETNILIAKAKEKIINYLKHHLQ